MEEDGFTLVTKRHRLCASKNRTHLPHWLIHIHNSPVSSTKPIPSSDSIISEICYVEYVDLFLSTFTNVLYSKFSSTGNGENVSLDIVVYGLGNFSCRMVALQQLSFLLYLKDRLSSSYSVRTFAFDPIFTAEEKSWLLKNGFDIIERNERGFRTITRATLFFMPHCGRALYNNVLFANWTPDAMNSLFILGNTFTNIVENLQSGHRDDLKYLVGAGKICNEIKLGPCNSDWYRAFSDTSLHYFCEKCVLPFERDAHEPSYSEEIW